MVADAAVVPEMTAKFAITCGTSRIPKIGLLAVEGIMSINNSRAGGVAVTPLPVSSDPTRALACASRIQLAHLAIGLVRTFDGP
jgi:hypothetical protein